MAPLLVLLLLGSWEVTLRLAGVVPSVASRQSVWITSRLRVRASSTVAAGTSRLLAVLDPGAWAAATEGEPSIQLSVLGGSSIRLLEHLAESSEYHGLVVSDIVPLFTFDTDSLPVELVDKNVRGYSRALISPAERIEAYLRTWIPGNIAFLRQELRPPGLVRSMSHGATPGVPAVQVRADGYAPLRFRAVGVEPNADRIMRPETFGHLRAVPPDSATFADQLSRLAKAVATIRGRGGDVVFIYLPACGGRRVIEDGMFPKARYWDPIVAIPGLITLDLDAYPGFGELACFDGSHVDAEDAEQITAWIAASVKSHLRVDGQR